MSDLLFRFSSTAAWWVLAIAACHCLIPPGAANAQNLLDQSALAGIYNDNEERGYFDMVMKPYPIPIRTTTYVDFVFNIPEDVPDLFHIVKGEVINSQPLHLHHFVLTGCTRTFDPSQEGVPIDADDLDDECSIQIGGWAPGSEMFGTFDKDVGMLQGRDLGVQSIRLNVHYTSGKYEDEENKIFKMATDGFRVHYTPTFRPYTNLGTAVLSIGFGPSELFVPPNQTRFYVTRTCKVEGGCSDNNEGFQLFQRIAGVVLAETCSDAIQVCGADGELGQFVRGYCPATCGHCEKTMENGEANPFYPDHYRMSGINYHAHLLGREMYATLLHEGEGNDGEVEIDAIDLKSKQIWIFDDQETVPFDFNDNDTSNRRGVDITPGDRIQVTCVFNSEERTENTAFGISTFDEMCITNTYVTFESPSSLMTNNGNSEMEVDLLTQLKYMTFRCKMDEESSVHTGALEADEDPRDIWKDHPLEDSQGCIFPVIENIPGAPFGGGMVRSADCSNDDRVMCRSGTTLMPDLVAGYYCEGGTKDGTTSHEGVTESDCDDGGGDFYDYGCADTNQYYLYDAANDGWSQAEIVSIFSSTYQSICCEDAESPVTDVPDPDLPGTEDDPKDEVPNDEKPNEVPKDEEPKDEVPKDEEPKDQKPVEDKPDAETPGDNSAATALHFEKSSSVLALGLLLYHLACSW